MNPFSKFLASLKKSVLSGPVDQVVGVDIGASSIKLVELKKKNGRAVLETYSTLALGPYAQLGVGATTNLSTEILVKALTDALREGSINARSAAMAIPSSASLVFTVELPPNLSEKDLATIVPTEARKYIPVPISEVSLDYWVIPHRTVEGDGTAGEVKTEVLVAAIHNETLTKYREIASGAGLDADIFEIELFSEIRSAFTHELSAVLIMDFGASKTKLAIVEYGIVRVFHIVNRASFDITTNTATALGVPFDQAEDIKRNQGLLGGGEMAKASEIARIACDYILSETATVIQNFERKYNKPVSKVILSGAGSLLPGFRELASEKLRIEVVSGDPFGKVVVPEFVARVLKDTGPEFSIALGAALRKLG